MSYTMLKNQAESGTCTKNGLEQEVRSFIRVRCQGLRFDRAKASSCDAKDPDHDGTSLKPGQIPYNMEKDIDRLCLENAVVRFLKSGKKEDAFDVYFCYLEMFIGDYEKTRRMIELLSEFEANGSGLLMKHRDHYSHSVYVFLLGLALYESNEIYRDAYKTYYELEGEQEAAYHYLQYWGLASLFHDIGYPFELPFEQVCSYFEVNKKKRFDKENNRVQIPFLAYQNLDQFTEISEKVQEKLKAIGYDCQGTNELFAKVLAGGKVGEKYKINEKQMRDLLKEKPKSPNQFNCFMDHAYFSATVLFKKLFEEMDCELAKEHLDALSAILMHNSLYKFCIANPDPEKPEIHRGYKEEGNIPFQAELHPLAYMLMLCDELQCWDRTAYGRNSRRELHPMGCRFDFSNNKIKATYLFDAREAAKINRFKDNYIQYLQELMENGKKYSDDEAPELKAYSGMFVKKAGKSEFQRDIERIVDLKDIGLTVETGLTENNDTGRCSYLSDSSFLNLYHFAMVLNGRWDNSAWKRAKESGREEDFLNDDTVLQKFSESFKALSLEYKLSNINQAKAFARYLNEINCFYTDKSVDFELVDKFSEEELVTIGVLEHQRWLQEHYDMGWTYGTPEKDRDFVRQHKDMIPGFEGGPSQVPMEAARANYDRLDKEEQDKDTDPMECMLAMLRMFDGLRIYRLR